MKKLFYVIIVSIVMVFGLTFVYRNQQVVTLDYYGSQPWGFSWEVQLSLLIIVTFIAGLLIGFLLSGISSLRLRGKLMSSNRKLRKAQSV